MRKAVQPGFSGNRSAGHLRLCNPFGSRREETPGSAGDDVSGRLVNFRRLFELIADRYDWDLCEVVMEERVVTVD